MSSIRSKNTKPELLVRRAIYKMGIRYRLHRRDLPGKPDIVFSQRRKIIMIHGCFWHFHADPQCKAAKIPSTRKAYWLPKLEATRRRDADALAKLTLLGWDTLVLWECDLKKALSANALEDLLLNFLENDDKQGLASLRAVGG